MSPVHSGVVDIGKSATRWSSQGAAGQGPGLAPDRATLDSAPAELADVVVAAWRDAGEPAVSHVLIGSTFLPRAELRGEVVCCLPPSWAGRQVALVSDGVLAHARQVGGVGVLLAVGTGTVAVAVDPHSRLRQFDGWGPDLGDRGSAWDLGRRGLAAALLAEDGVGAQTILQPRARELLGVLDPDAAAELLAEPAKVAVVAGFAGVVDAAAGTDPVAASLVERAVGDAVATAVAAAAWCGVDSVTVTGGMLHLVHYRAGLEAGLAARGLRAGRGRDSSADQTWTVMSSGPYARLEGLSFRPHTVNIGERRNHGTSTEPASGPAGPAGEAGSDARQG